MLKVGTKVEIANVEKVKNDEHLESNALEIIKKSNFQGEITKVENGIHFVGFKNEIGWVTQGFKADELGVVK